MKLSKTFTERHRHLLASMRQQNNLPPELDLDALVILGQNRLIEFKKSGGFTVTERGQKLLDDKSIH